MIINFLIIIQGSMKRRVVVTGLGAVTPIGNTVDVFWDEIKKKLSESDRSLNLTFLIIK